MRRIAALILALCGTAVMLPGSASAAEPTRLVVDDDGQQCAADFTSIQAAVDHATSGDVVQVCPGRYAERVVVDKPLVLRGQPDAIEALDCFATEPLPDDADVAGLVIVEPPDSVLAPLFTLAADDVEVAGFVMQGMRQQAAVYIGDYPTYTPLLATDAGYAGYQIHHNLLRSSTLGAELGGNATARTRFHHNCLRDNRWALANQRQPLDGARIDHNESFRTEIFAYEIGWGYAGTEAVLLDHNVSRADYITFRVENSTATTIDQNDSTPGGRGILVYGGNTQFKLTGNVFTGGSLGGIAFPAPGTAVPQPTVAPLVSGNTVTGFSAVGISLGRNAQISGAEIAANVASGNGTMGVQIFDGNGPNLFTGNIADRNGLYGIRTWPGASGNTIRANQMLGNGQYDAREESYQKTDDGYLLLNSWLENTCATAFPTSTICSQA